MKQLYTILLLALALPLPSCKKYIEQQEENAILKIMTTGQWYVTEYVQNSNDITDSFSGYLFKFNSNGTVIGTDSNSSASGTWSANISALSITSAFPTSGDPLKLLNETWKITDSGDNYVVANSTDSTNDTMNILQLQKQ